MTTPTMVVCRSPSTAGRAGRTQDNQPTAQFYHVNVDDAVSDYRLYSGQQDNSSVIIKTRGDGPNIPSVTGRTAAGCESAHIGVRPQESALRVRRLLPGHHRGDGLKTGLTRQIMAWPAFASPSRRTRSSTASTGTSPAACRRTIRKTIYHGGNVLFRSGDRGDVDPDLFRPHAQRQGDAGLGRHAVHERRRRRRGVRHHLSRSRSRRRRQHDLRWHRRRPGAAHPRWRQDLDERHADGRAGRVS